MLYEDWELESDSTTVKNDTRMSPTDTPVKIPTNSVSVIQEKSVFEIFTQRKIKGKRKKVWEEKN